MEPLYFVTVVGGVALAGIGAFMTLTNPGQHDYEDYATEALTVYLKQEVCPQAPGELGGFLVSYCKTLVDTGRPHIETLITKTTNRHNYLLFSIYETELTLPSPVPNYEFETIGAFQQFYTYQAEEF
jgi:hypothetical protein